VAAPGSTQNPHRYAGALGYYRDGEERQLLMHRYYGPGEGRFLTQDPIRHG
jgi:RHS repeat-associated protein